MTRIGNSFRNFRDRIRAAVSLKPRNIVFFVALFLILLLALLVRLSPILRGPTLIKAFDPWIQYYNAKYLSEHTVYEYFHWRDTKSWYPEGTARYHLRPGLTFTVVIIYLVLKTLGFPITIYEVCYYFPAFMGAITVYSIYLLGKEIHSRGCGLFAAFFLALNTGHMQRTMAGFFDNETIGVFATLMCFLFFLKAIRTGKFTHSILGGVFLGYLSLSWGGFQFVFYILPLICVFIILLNQYNENVLIAYIGTQGTGMLLYSLYINFTGQELFENLSFGGPFLFSFILLAFHFLYNSRINHPRTYTITMNTIKWGLIPVVLVIAIIIWVNPQLIPLGVGSRINSVLSPLVRDQMHIVASVAEHMPSAWSIFYYNTLIPLLLIPLGIFFCFKRLNYADIFLMTFTLILFYFTGSMIRIILLFAPAASLMGAYGLINVLKIYGTFVGERKLSMSRKRKRQLKRIVGNSEVFSVYFLVGVLCMAQIFHASDISINQLSYSQMVTGGQFHDWEESLVWMKNNLQGTDVVVSWWDYGYWLTPIGNVTTVNDNATVDSKKIGLTGMALMQTNEIYSAKVFRELEADYVLVYFGFLLSGFGGDEGKWPWMLRICNDHYEAYKDMDLEEDNWADNAVFDESEYINETSGLYEEKWFQSQLVRLMFYGEPTSPGGVNPNTDYLGWYYASQVSGNPSQGINAREDDEGNDWSDHIPEDGQYDFKVFKPAYFSENGLVKLYKIDYTALDSSFEIKEPKVYDDQYATFKLENTGIKDLEIKTVSINNVEYNYTMGESIRNNILSENEQDVVWINMNNTNFELYDSVDISVTAEADALEGSKYTFEESTGTFFVSKAPTGEIAINREGSVVMSDGESTKIQLEIENTGQSTVKIDKFYVNDEDNILEVDRYISGSSVIESGNKISVLLDGNFSEDDSIEFKPLSGVKGNMIGVEAVLGEKDETIFSFNNEDYKLSILSQERTFSPELDALEINNNTYKYHIPYNYDNIQTYAYDNGTVKLRVKNTGDTVLGLESVYIAKASSVRYGNVFNLTSSNLLDSQKWSTANQKYTLDTNEENVINIDASHLSLKPNDDVVLALTGGGLVESVCADIGILKIIDDETQIRLIEKVDNLIASYVLADDTGEILVKNIGNQPITLTGIKLNETTQISIPGDTEFEVGDSTLDVQECAIISFEVPSGLDLNVSNSLIVNVTTNNPTVYTYDTIIVIENAPDSPNYYNIEIDETNTEADATNLKITVDNPGETSVQVNSVYVNNTFISLDNFINSEFDIDREESLELEIELSVLNGLLGFSVSQGDSLKILVRTKKGAEDIVDNHIV
ncbi:MAG: hypothetical protein GF383_00630 [Candidatus Lokiarchaeota archaeon]|nr:hypothetical protein [Candidatus Lokiarchaeota archaeon]MBD3337678.1 hypothetical protein [Candidatus Lokiarchaeota archaeon]